MGTKNNKDNSIQKERFTCHYSGLDDEIILKFANTQSNFNDAVRYLIQNHINERGIEDLSNVLPSKRSPDFKLPPLNCTDKITYQAASEKKIIKDVKLTTNDEQQSESIPQKPHTPAENSHKSRNTSIPPGYAD